MSQYYQLFVTKLDTVVHDNRGPFTPYLEKAEKISGVKRIVLAQTLLGLLSLYLIIGRGAQFVCNMLGFAYPAYKSLVALETSNNEDNSKWLTYWVVFAAFSVIEFFSDILLNWFPLYWFAKVVFLLWCSADIPNGGSSIIYNHMIRPLFLQHKSRAPDSNGSPSNKNIMENLMD